MELWEENMYPRGNCVLKKTAVLCPDFRGTLGESSKEREEADAQASGKKQMPRHHPTVFNWGSLPLPVLHIWGLYASGF